MELIGHVARWKRHLIKLIDIPACEEQPPRSRVGPDCFHQLGDLVVAFFLATVKISFDQFIARPIHPLSAIDGAKITPFPCEFLLFHDSPLDRKSFLLGKSGSVRVNTGFALVTGVPTCALPSYGGSAI